MKQFEYEVPQVQFYFSHVQEKVHQFLFGFHRFDTVSLLHNLGQKQEEESRALRLQKLLEQLELILI